MKRRAFNLLKPLEPPRTIWDKVYDWILWRARIVILITEILIVIAFFAKVIQDTDAKNKENEINRLSSEINFYSQSLEPQFRTIENKDNMYKLIWNNSTKYYEILNEMYSYISNSSSEVNLRIEGREVTIFGTENLATLQNLETALKASPSFSSVVIRSLSLEQQEILEQRGDYILTAIIKDLNRENIP